MFLLNHIIHTLLQIKGIIIFKRKVGVLGNFTVINPRNVSIGADCGINHDVFILGAKKIIIGKNVVLSARAMILDSSLDTENYSQVAFPKHKSNAVIIEDGVWVGAGAIILPGVTIGEKSIVGAGSVVTRDVPPFTIVAGNPARQIGKTNI